MRILAIDTSTSAASCAVMSDGKLEGEVFFNHKLHHSVLLFPMIEEVLERVEITMDDIDVVAVGGGPGSFTGLRIGVAAAKGLSIGGNKNFIGISALDAMAFEFFGFKGIICPMMDALRENIYTTLYRWENGKLIKLIDYNAVHIDELIETLLGYEGEIIFTGDCINTHRAVLMEKLSTRVNFAQLSRTMPRASAIAELAYLRAMEKDYDDINTFSPVYLRKPQAEREYEKKHGVIL